MDDEQVIGRINEIAREEHELWEREGRGEATHAERERLQELGVTLDQCWDLLHQRRARRAAGMIHGGDRVVQAFAAAGWEWGGTWRSVQDYQHFSANGK